MSDSSEKASSDVGVGEALQSPLPVVKRNPFRSTFFNITILGVACFLSPGLWGATAALGAGGTQSPQLVNASNSATFSLMVVTGLLTPALVRLTSIKTALIIGTTGYAPYAATLYSKSYYGDKANWSIPFGASLCGISAGIFWAAEGAIALTYPEPKNRGRYLSYWLSFRVMGQFVGGAILLGLNAQANTAGSVSKSTYLVLVILQALAPFVAALISPPEKVQRSDGSPVLLRMHSSLRAEIKNTWKTLTTPRVLLVLPFMWQGTFSESLIGTYAADNFTVRSRALGSLLSAVVGALGVIVLGLFLDWRKWSLNTRSKAGFLTIATMQAGWWIFAVVIMNRYNRIKPTYDWVDGPWSSGFALYLLLQLGFNLQYEFMYFIIGGFGNGHEQVVRLASILRATESAGQAVSYGINSTSLRLDAVAGINFALFALSVVPVWFVVRRIGFAADGVTKLYEPPVYAEPEERAQLAAQGVEGALGHDASGKPVPVADENLQRA
ncbi:hypothetical protein IE81DRAFT_229549 [Ceraceosorus guamensis]|uniref:MFS general substrate transporter n=1 Tax=Ceraceosorus guamensis TaxID=1522189 RepID=A0A316W8L4_9BASI|nr:hypothetical protein IE81DRAFT_229549 [Ceraceosorus guamensis]PWN45101.1 hypothetical protein IE81DRAFT_229549 [Ceraceosorus guamensis]